MYIYSRWTWLISQKQICWLNKCSIFTQSVAVCTFCEQPIETQKQNNKHTAYYSELLHLCRATQCRHETHMSWLVWTCFLQEEHNMREKVFKSIEYHYILAVVYFIGIVHGSQVIIGYLIGWKKSTSCIPANYNISCTDTCLDQLSVQQSLYVCSHLPVIACPDHNTLIGYTSSVIAYRHWIVWICKVTRN